MTNYIILMTQRYKIYNNYESTDEINYNYFIMNSKYNNYKQLQEG